MILRYIILESIDKKDWFECYSSIDLDFIKLMYNSISEKNNNKYYKLVAVIYD